MPKAMGMKPKGEIPAEPFDRAVPIGHGRADFPIPPPEIEAPIFDFSERFNEFRMEGNRYTLSILLGSR